MVKFFVFFLFSVNLWGADYQGGDIHAIDYHWFQTNLYHGKDQRGGPFKFDDSYLELEFGGRSGVLDYYGYIDFLDIFNDAKNSDRHDGNNSFAKIDARLSFDSIFEKDLAVGAVKEWYIALEMQDADNESLSGSNALRVFWAGLGTDTEVPWLGLVGLNLQARYFVENYGASNEGEWDGYVLHINWFKVLHSFSELKFLAFQGYADYEFASDIKGNARSSTSFQSYLGVWFHAKHFALGYGAKIYDNMTNFRDGELFFGKETDTTGIGHYFNISYKF